MKKIFRGQQREELFPVGFSSTPPSGGKDMGVARARLTMLVIVFSCIFSVVCGRLGWLMIGGDKGDPVGEEASRSTTASAGRADIVDRNGVVLATSLVTQSLFVNPKMILNPGETAEKLAKVLPELAPCLLSKLQSEKGFVWLKRNLTPKQQGAIYKLGLPGIGFQREEKRLYPQGRLFSHVLGTTDVDSRGISGIERYFDEALIHEREPLQVAFDVRVQHVLRDEVLKKIQETKAKGGSGLVMDVETNEVLAILSLPDADPHHVNQAKKEELFNSASLAVFEMGSTMKILTTALALDSGAVTLQSSYDISKPIPLGRFRIKDYHPRRTVADVPQIFLYSSNIGMVKMIQEVGIKRHKEYLTRFGLLDPTFLELSEMGAPLVPARWQEASSMTIAYGYGLSVSPVQIANAVAAVVNGGILRRPTLLKVDPKHLPAGIRVISHKTSQHMRDMLRLVVQLGTGRKANVPGYDVGGKTGTAEKVEKGRYTRNNMVSFVGAFPMSQPKYLIMVMVDDPKGSESTHGFATAGWIAAPVVKNVVTRIAPMLGVQPQLDVNEDPETMRLYNASMKMH